MEDTGSWVSLKSLRWAADIRSVYIQERVAEEQPYPKIQSQHSPWEPHQRYLQSNDKPGHRRGATAFSAELELMKTSIQVETLTKELERLKEEHRREIEGIRREYERRLAKQEERLEELEGQKDLLPYLSPSSEATDSPCN